jgi:hypothetical protein
VIWGQTDGWTKSLIEALSGGDGEVRGGVDKKEGELKEQIHVKVSTKFQINPSTND